MRKHCKYLPVQLTWMPLGVTEGDFQELQQNFLQKYYHEFDDNEENKFIYTDIHKEYVSTKLHAVLFGSDFMTARYTGFLCYVEIVVILKNMVSFAFSSVSNMPQ